MSAHQIQIECRKNHLSLQAQRIAKQMNEITQIENQFNQENPVVLHRRNGWVNEEEKKKIQTYFAAGISAQRMAQKFAVTTATIYRHLKAAQK